MKIVTVNVPEAYIDAIARLIGEGGLYPSRSELIRVAVREFLIKELRLAKNMPDYNKPDDDNYDKEKFVRVPIIDNDNPNAPITQFKTYKIVKRLEF